MTIVIDTSSSAIRSDLANFDNTSFTAGISGAMSSFVVWHVIFIFIFVLEFFHG